MTVGLRHPTDPDAFLRWVERQEERYELVEGDLRMMVGVSRDHAIVSGRLYGFLFQALRGSSYLPFAGEFGVKTGNGVRFPDIFVDEGPVRGKERAAQAPVLVAEILSPSSMEEDFGRKPHEYKSIPSLKAYVVLSQDEPRAWLWRWTQEGWSDSAEDIEGQDAILSLDLSGLTLEIPFAEIYAGFTLNS